MFVDLDWPLNASSLLSASAELLVCLTVTLYSTLIIYGTLKMIIIHYITLYVDVPEAIIFVRPAGKNNITIWHAKLLFGIMFHRKTKPFISTRHALYIRLMPVTADKKLWNSATDFQLQTAVSERRRRTTGFAPLASRKWTCILSTCTHNNTHCFNNHFYT